MTHFQSTDSQKSPAHPFIHPSSHLFLFFPFPPFLSEVQAEGAEVAGGIVCVDHGRGGDGDEELVAGPQLKQPSLVDGVEGVLGVWSPALCSHPLQELHGRENQGEKDM